MGKRHGKILNSLGFTDLHYLDPESKKKRFRLKEIYSSFEELNSQDFQGAIISSPANNHFEGVKFCLSRNLPFMLEKPLSHKSKNWRTLTNSIETKNLKNFVAYPRRFGYAYKYIKTCIEKKKIGEIKFVFSNFSQDFRKYRPDYKNTYYVNRDMGGGIILDALSHHLDLMIYFFGDIKKIKSLSKNIVIKNSDCEDFAILNLSFLNRDIEGLIIGNQFQKPNTDFIEITGTKKSIKYDRILSRLSISKGDGWTHKKIDGDWNYFLEEQIKNFIKMLKGKKFEGTSLREALNNLETIEQKEEI